MRGAIQHRSGRASPWRARYRAPDGSEISRSFIRKIDAERWLQDELSKLNRGRWIDPSAGQVTFAESVSEAATEVRGQLVFGTPKSHRTRTVMTPSWLADQLGAHLGDLDPRGLVCTATKGGPMRASNFRRAVWAPALDAAGIDPGLRMHDLRHTAASLMISSGASTKAVQRQLGHASAAMTLDLYGHLYDDDLEALADALDRRYAAAHTRPKPSAEVISIEPKTRRNP